MRFFIALLIIILIVVFFFNILGMFAALFVGVIDFIVKYFVPIVVLLLIYWLWKRSR